MIKLPKKEDWNHEFKKSKDFPKACRVCECLKENPIHKVVKFALKKK